MPISMLKKLQSKNPYSEVFENSLKHLYRRKEFVYKIFQKTEGEKNTSQSFKKMI